MTDKRINQEDLLKVRDAKQHAERILNNAKLEIENANLKFQNILLNIHVKYQMSADEYFNIETGEIIKKEEKKDVE